MTTATILPTGRTVFLDASNVPLAGGSVYFYVPNTTTPKSTWQDAGEINLNSNPVILDANGSALIYGSGQYTMSVFDNLGNLVYTALTQDTFALVNLANVAFLNVQQQFTAGQAATPSPLVDGASIPIDFSLSNNFSVTLGGNRTLANPTNVNPGQSGNIAITQDATGSRTLAYGVNWKFNNGSAPTLTTTAGATDLLVYYSNNITL